MQFRGNNIFFKYVSNMMTAFMVQSDVNNRNHFLCYSNYVMIFIVRHFKVKIVFFVYISKIQQF